MRKVTFKTAFICFYKGGAQKYENITPNSISKFAIFRAGKKCVGFFAHNSEVFRPIFEFRVSLESWLRGEYAPNFSRRYDIQELRYKHRKLCKFFAIGLQ